MVVVSGLTAGARRGYSRPMTQEPRDDDEGLAGFVSSGVVLGLVIGVVLGIVTPFGVALGIGVGIPIGIVLGVAAWFVRRRARR